MSKRLSSEMALFLIFLIVAFYLPIDVSYALLPEGYGVNSTLQRADSDSIVYTNTSFIIESSSPYGNLSFALEWENTELYIQYNGTQRQIKELKTVAFTNKNANYTIEYWTPRLLYEYIDVDGDGLFTGSYNQSFLLPGPDTYVSGYKIDIIMDMTNITVETVIDGEPIYKWVCTQLAMPMQADVQGPWEKYPVVKEVFHYYSMNGTLKMDIILDNFRPSNESTRIFITYGVRFIRLEPGYFTVAFDDHELSLNDVDKVCAVNSTTIKFKVNGIERAMFDFGGRLLIDDNFSANLRGSIGPPDLYWSDEKYDWITIGLNYPHIKKKMIHDPYFGLILSAATSITPYSPYLATTTAIASTIILIIVILNYRKTRNLHRYSFLNWRIFMNPTMIATIPPKNKFTCNVSVDKKLTCIGHPNSNDYSKQTSCNWHSFPHYSTPNQC